MNLRFSAFRVLVAACAAIGMLRPCANALEITFDTSHDTNGFFQTGTQARNVLNAAGNFFETILTDDLQPIIPAGANSWQAFYTNPQTGGPEFALNPAIAADTIVIYVGARDLGGNLGFAVPGTAFPIGGDAAWNLLLASRGEGTNDFGPWGGTVSVANNVTWNYSTTEGVGGTFSLYSNLLHEIGHVLGIGTSESWDDQVNSTTDVFTGAFAKAAYGGGDVPLSADEGHWQEGTTGVILGSGTINETAMDPTLAPGDFKPWTDLDGAALEDIGWELDYTKIPEPGSGLLAQIAAAVLLLHRRRR